MESLSRIFSGRSTASYTLPNEYRDVHVLRLTIVLPIR